MRRFLPALIVWMFASIFGCGIPNETEANRHNLDFEGFPSYTIDRPIVERIEIVVPIGYGTTQETVQVETATRDTPPASSSTTPPQTGTSE